MGIEIDMTGKAALVTGAASGLGRATALKLAEAGAQLCLVDVNAEALAETAGLTGGEPLLHVADLADPDACKGAVDVAVDQFGRLDALCNVAGIFKFMHVPDVTRPDWERIMAINLSAPFYLSQAAIPHLLETDGAIVNVASTAAIIGEAYAAAYCASKGGLAQLTKAMAMEYQRKPIRINAVCPGGMATNISTGMAMPDGLEWDLIQRYSGLRGLVDVGHVADLIALLASPAGQSYHGVCIAIDAGITAG